MGLERSSRIEKDEFWALRNISFQLKRGEALGIVGLNGAGKSTLLKILLKRMAPDDGHLNITGNAGGLVELGAGFHPEHSGIKNIEINARVLGVSEKELKRKLNQIIEFAELGEFIEMPVKTYSSGMIVRLGFSTAIHFVSDLIICDEILAVGDFRFRQKCLQKMKEIRKSKSIILVSHGMQDIPTFCDEAILLHKGELILKDDPETVIGAYSLCSRGITAEQLRKKVKLWKTEKTNEDHKISNGESLNAGVNVERKTDLTVIASSRAQIVSRVNSDYSDEQKSSLFYPEFWDIDRVADVTICWNLKIGELGYQIRTGEKLIVEIAFTLLKEVESLRIGLPFFDPSGNMILGPDSRDYNEISRITKPGVYRIGLELDPIPVNQGRFWPVLALNEDPAHLYRKHLPYIDIINTKAMYGTVLSFPKWKIIDVDYPSEV